MPWRAVCAAATERRRWPRRAGLLATFNAAGVLELADVHTAEAIGRIGQESDERVPLALALAVRALRNGSVCIDLTVGRPTTVFDDGRGERRPGRAALARAGGLAGACLASPRSPTGPRPGGRPLRLAAGLLYLERYWQQEEQVRRQLQHRRAADPPAVDATG